MGTAGSITAENRDGDVADVLVAIGASAGGVVALQELLGALGPSFPGAVLAVVHLAPHQPSFLARVLDRSSVLPVRAGVDGEPVRAGRVYVAPPDHHLLVEQGRIKLGRSPAEHGHRPSVDALFRSAAREGGTATIGVVLTGALDDGAAGLRDIKARGGLAAVQDPTRSDHPGMPAAALAAVDPDAVGSPAELARWIDAQAPRPAPPRPTQTVRPGEDR